VFKKIISFLLICSLSLSMCTSALAFNHSTSDFADFTIGDLDYIEKRTNDGLFILTSYRDGKMFDRVTIQMGSNEISYEQFHTSNTKIPAAPVAQTYYISDIIKPNVKNAMRAGYSIKKGSLGTVEYTAIDVMGPQIRTLSFTSAFDGSINSRFDVSGPEGTAWSVIISAIVAGFDYYITGGLGKAILIAVVGSLSGSFTSKAFSTSIDGTCYRYNVTAKAEDKRTSTHGGEVYYGSLKKDGKWVHSQTIYDGYYPEFIAEKDTAVAVWFYQDFGADTFSVNW